MTELICIGCPQGCTLDVELASDGNVEVRGAQCRRGRQYARNELTDPRRTVSTTIAVRGGAVPLVAVRSAAPIPKRCVMAALKEVKQVVLEAPVVAKQVVIESVAGCGVPMITTRPVKRGEGA